MRHSRTLTARTLLHIREHQSIHTCNYNNRISFIESTLKKKHHSINYNYVRECVAAGIGYIFKVDTGDNLADLFTKVLDKVKRKKFVTRILR